MGTTLITDRPGTAPSPPGNAAEQVAWLHRRAGFSLTPDEMDAAATRGVTAELDRLTDPGANGIPASPVPWADEDFLAIDKPRKEAPRIIGAWLDHLLGAPRPLEQRLVFMLHGLVVSSVEKVANLGLMARQIQLYQAMAAGSYPELLKAVSVDGAMLWYLDGRDSTGSEPNENFGRELLELFALGVGNYTEADVKAAARALTGWTLRGDRRRGVVAFQAARHDQTPQTLLGASGVTDVETVINAVTAQPEHTSFVARRVAKEFLGTATDDDLAVIGNAYESGGHRLVPAVRAALELGLAGHGSPIVLAPVPWLLMARRVTATAPRLGRRTLAASGQIPLAPPNVSGWPGGKAWLSTSTMVARMQMAAVIAKATADDLPLKRACAQGAVTDIARLLGLAEPFSASTATALEATRSADQRLATALVSPEFLLS